jgi:polyisoprenoid-binding protein YceI
MTDAPMPDHRPTDRRRRRRLVLGAGIAAAMLVGGAAFATWYFVFRDDAPPAVNVEEAAKSAKRSQGATAPSTDLDGTWSIDPTIGDFTDFTSTFAGYRVQEELASIGAKTAFGRTPDVSGALTLDGTTITATSIEVDMTTLTSDNPRRDGSLRDQALETARFPTATFELTEPIRLRSIPKDGTAITVDATGELTLHGVTREVTIPLQAVLQGEVIAVTGSLDITFADYDIDQPRSLAVLSIEDHGVLELQLFFTKE